LRGVCTHFIAPFPLQDQIKQLLTGLMLSTPQLIRAQLSEALTIISSHDFPANWPQLLPELVERLNGGWARSSSSNWATVVSGAFKWQVAATAAAA
jgi:exportin-2 (importin alpha re-exporter)